MSPSSRRILAGFWRRLGCALIDFASVAVALLILAYMSLALGIVASPRELFAFLLASMPGLAMLLLALMAFAVVCWAAMCATPGQLVMGCQVVDARSGRRLPLTRAALRCAGFAASLLALGLGVLWIAWDRRKQGWHDKIAGTLVVLEDESQRSLRELAGAALR